MYRPFQSYIGEPEIRKELSAVAILPNDLRTAGSAPSGTLSDEFEVTSYNSRIPLPKSSIIGQGRRFALSFNGNFLRDPRILLWKIVTGNARPPCRGLYLRPAQT